MRELGRMLCTSRAISAALRLAPLARFADLDGPTWLAVDVEPALFQHRRASSLRMPVQQVRHRLKVFIRRPSADIGGNSAVMQGRPISAHQPKEPGVSSRRCLPAAG